MKNASVKQALTVAAFCLSVANAGIALAHSGGGVIDAAGTNASATDLAAVTCYDDGNGAPHHLFGQVLDASKPVPGLLVSFQIYKGLQMITSTDAVSGDAFYSPGVSLNGGAGQYMISVSKTAAGARTFDVIWHCMTKDDIHTGTDINVYQAQ